MDKARIIEMANNVAASGLLDGTMAPVRKLIDTHDVVMAVWQDAEEPDGVGTLLVKGDHALRTIVANQKARAMTITAIPCTCAEQAAALKKVAGEPRRTTDRPPGRRQEPRQRAIRTPAAPSGPRLRTALAEEEQHGRTVLFPVRVDDAVMDTTEQWTHDIRRARHIGDFTRWKEHDAYRQALERLLRDLQVEAS